MVKKFRNEQMKPNEQDAYCVGIKPLQMFLFLSPFLYGGFFEWAACAYSVFLIGYLLYCGWKAGALLLFTAYGLDGNGMFAIHGNLTLLSITVLVIFYALSSFWAVDHGMAIFGFCKFLPFFLFAVAAMQVEPAEREKLLQMIPLSGGVMVALSFALGQISALRNLFFVNHRLAGFFQYPNTFALFLLAGVIVLTGDGRWDAGKCSEGVVWRKNRMRFIGRFLCLIALLSGIMLSGSRTVFFLLVVVMLIFIITLREKRIRWTLCSLLGAVVVVTVAYAAVTGNVSAVARYLTSSLESSTFLGRILYFKDALPVIVTHPFGLGYMGYYYTQGSFQTGVYTVLNVHNELLQILLDVGWIPAILFMAAVIKSFFRKTCGLTKRMLLFVIMAHCMFDFDLQFASVGFVLILAMDLQGGKIPGGKLRVGRGGILVMGCILAGLCIWLGAASFCFHRGHYEAAVKLYPDYTNAYVSMLPQVENVDDMERVADEVLSRNQSVSLAYDAKARAAYARGDFEGMISYKLKAISLAKYELDEYLDYFQMLYVGMRLYMENGDASSAEYCRERLMEIPDMLDEVRRGTDKLAWKINDKPELALPDEYQEVLALWD